jgi:hypothetical protein
MSENTVDDIRNLYEGIVSNNQETLSEIGNMGGLYRIKQIYWLLEKSLI